MSTAVSVRPIMNPADPVKDTQAGDPPARQIAYRLINSRSERKAGDSRARATAGACDDLYRDLSRWVGRDGCHALFARALAEAQVEYATLDQIKLRPRSEPYVEGVGETIVSHGDAATAEALESILVHLVELLGRLIGNGMATNLIERSVTAAERGEARPDDKREEA